MEVVAFPPSPPAKCIGDGRFNEISMKLSEDFSKFGFQKGEGIRNLERSWSKLEKSVEFNDEEEEEEEEEFSFACVNAQGSPITADEAFEDGQIRPVFPLFNRNLLFDYENENQNDDVSVTDNNRPRLRKLFVEDRNGDGDGGEAVSEESEKEPLGPYCSWSGETIAEASPETCRKSNSTGFSKLWRFRDLVLRSNSDGRDAFVFLNSNNVGDKTQSSSTAADKKITKKGKEKTTSSEDKKKKKKKTTTKSAHEKLYMRNRAMKEEGKHRSYLPYKQVGFFTNVNGLSRNIHPF